MAPRKQQPVDSRETIVNYFTKASSKRVCSEPRDDHADGFIIDDVNGDHADLDLPRGLQQVQPTGENDTRYVFLFFFVIRPTTVDFYFLESTLCTRLTEIE